MIAGSPHSMATMPVVAILVSVVMGAGAAFLGRTVQVLRAASRTPALAPPRAMWPRSAPPSRAARHSAPTAIAETQIAAVVERYRHLLHATEPVDRAAAEDAVGALFRAGGAEPPPCIWVRSPLEALLARIAISAFRQAVATNAIEGAARSTAWRAVRTHGPIGVPADQWTSVVDGLEANQALTMPRREDWVWEFPPELLGPPDPMELLTSAVGEREAGLLRRKSFIVTSIAERLGDAIIYTLSSREGSGVAAAAKAMGFAKNMTFLVLAEYLDTYEGVALTARARTLINVLESSGGWWPMRGAVVLSERPTFITCDEADRLHSEAGPAVEYADGWRIHAIHGMAVPAVSIEHPETMTVRAIQAEVDPRRRAFLIGVYGEDQYLDVVAESLELIHAEPNIRTRRAAIGRYGVERFVEATGSVIDSDLDAQGQMRRLWRAARQNDDALVLVEVVNSTPELDGSRHHYWLRVPSWIRRCQDAVAWTFALPAPEYHPLFES